MDHLFKKNTAFARTEFWVITTIFVFVLFFFIRNIFEWDDRAFEEAPYKGLFDAANLPFRFYKHYFYPYLVRYTVLYLAFLALNFVIIPGLLTRKNVVRNIVLLLLVFAGLVVMYHRTDINIHAYRYAALTVAETNRLMLPNAIDQSFTIFGLLIVYTLIKYFGIYLLAISSTIETRYRFLRKEAIVATAAWLTGLLFFRFVRVEHELMIGWAIVVPSAIVLYLASFYRLIPRALGRKNHSFLYYILQSGFVLFVAFIIIYLMSLLINDRDDAGAGYSAFNSFFQLFITAPLTWILYKKSLKKNKEINDLQNELGHSNAKFDFLRSQINPHFLFNALNTLYGTAIQENAERTSEGIQKLGDMMRFMLQENMQDKISLAREIDYLKNYISLQRLRTDANPMVDIQTAIEDNGNLLQVSPMLLIPFVENAFKHGISFKEASPVKVSLQVKGSTLYYDVCNNIHPRHEHDPETGQTGIGLENVKQRLKYAYPGRHELTIHNDNKEFSVQLVLRLGNEPVSVSMNVS